MLRRRHAGRPLPDRRRPSPAMNVKYILFLHSKQNTFPFRARLAAGLGAARDGGLWLAAKAYEMTSAWTRPTEAHSERNLPISAPRTCSTSVTDIVPGLTRPTLTTRPVSPQSMPTAKDCRPSPPRGDDRT